MRKIGIFLLVLGCMIAGQAQGAETLYGVTFANQLIAIDSSTGAGSLIGNLDSDMAAFGLGDRNGTLYTFDQLADKIQQLDPLTGSTLATIDIGTGNITGEGALAFRSDGTGFLNSNSGSMGTLWSFDITVPSSTQITSDYGLDPSIDGMDFSSSDVLYGLSQQTANLYTIDQTTGATSLVGSTGLSTGSLGGLTFGSDGTLYAILNNSLYGLNVNTGAASLIGSTGYTNISGLTAIKTAVVPAPGALLLGTIGFSLVGYLKRKKHI